MAQNMAVSVTLRLQDQFTGPVKNLVQQLQGLTRAAQEFNRAFAGTGSTSSFGRMQQQVRAVSNDVRQLANQFGQLNRSMSAPSGGGLVQSQVAGMRQLLGLQTQAIANNNRLNAGAGGGRGPTGPGGASSFWGRRGFSPNASLADRAQYRGVNFLEQSLGEAILQPDIARTRLRRLDLPPETMRMAEEAAAQYSRLMPELTRGAILSTVAEIVTQFRTDAEAFQALPYLLRVQQLDIQSGRRGTEGMLGMLDLLKAVGMTGRLTDPEGDFTEQETANVLDAYLRAREIGGVDINPAGFRQLVKYMKASAQTLNVDAILEAALLAPDVGFSTFGNQTAMLIRGFAGGRATKEALEAQARWGLRSAEIDPRHPSGPHRLRAGALVDAELSRENPSEWVRRHILGPQGVLRRMGIDPMRSSPAAIVEALAPLNSNVSAESMLTTLVQLQGELRNQLARARGLNRGRPMWERGAMDEAAEGSLWTGLQRARSRIVDAMQSIGDNLTDVVLPPLNRFADILHNISDWTNPRTGNPAVGMGVLAGGGVGAFLLARSLLGRVGPWGRTLIGGTGGLLLGGDVSSLLMGAMIGRGFGSGGINPALAAGTAAAGAVAARSWGGRFLAVLAGILRRIPGMLAITAGIYATEQIIQNWETVSKRLKEIWESLRQAAPRWIGGEGQGWGAIAGGQGGFAQLGKDIRDTLTAQGILGPEHGFPQIDTPLNREFALGERPWYQRPPPFPAPWELAGNAWRWMWGTEAPAAAAPSAQVSPSSTVTVTGNPITINITTPPGASAQAIGEAAGNAVQSGLRGALSDLPPMP